ncbi:MAG: FAD-dependent monooxygenase [Proteobacteria bacterium]|nr:FAD-dependent monooxygenase [Pseudomonadota bacterium]MDE3207359.1 FAD-dependent monooxygenase [Pseudomonadota bacterium]
MVDIDILVCGSGIAGSALSLALVGSGLKVVLVSDKQPGSSTGRRVYALSPASQRFLARLGIWDRLDTERIEPIKAMQVFGDGEKSQLSFCSSEYGVAELGWIVSEGDLQLALDDELNKTAVTRQSARIMDVHGTPDFIQASFDDRTGLSTSLLVGADGGQSFVRNHVGFESCIKTYGHRAVTFNIKASIPHSGVARQWFDKGCILAFLPLPNNFLSVVWSMPEKEAGKFLDQSEANQIAELSQASFGKAGTLSDMSSAQSFPLSLLSLASPVMDRVALMGDAAHIVHPLAGQGANLGIQDAEALAEVILHRGKHDPGERFLLNQYAYRRARAVKQMQKITDGLQYLFVLEDPFSEWLRNVGMQGVNRLPWVKKQIMKVAMYGGG